MGERERRVKVVDEGGGIVIWRIIYGHCLCILTNIIMYLL